MHAVDENNVVVQVQIPQNAAVGDEFLQTLSNGVTVSVTVPPGAQEGDIVDIVVPLPNADVGAEDKSAVDDLNSMNTLPFCTTFTITRVLSAFCLAVCLGIVATVVHVLSIQTSSVALFALTVIIGAIMPPMLWMIWYSEGIGGHSIDRCQIAIVFFTNTGLIGFWILIASFVLRDLFGAISSSGNQVHPYHQSQDQCCFPYLEKGSQKNLSGVVYNGNFVVNETTNKLVVDESKYKPVCVCPLSALDLILWSALPEEILKYLSILFFSYRSYIADPEAMMSISLASGAGFALIENILYVVSGATNPVITLIRIVFPFPLHVLCQMINGVHLAKRKFVYRETGLQCDCKCTGKLPWWYIIWWPFVFHAIHNGSSELIGNSTSPGMAFLYSVVIVSNLVIGYAYLRYKYIQLSHIPRVDVKKLQLLGWLPRGFCCRLPCWQQAEKKLERRLTSIYKMDRQAKSRPAEGIQLVQQI